jgi:hypothetical protein
MPSKRPRAEYTEETLAEAIFDITDGGLSVRMAAQKWGVPRATISDRLHGVGAVRDQRQPDRVLTDDQEANLSRWILRMESLGYGPSHSQIRACVLAILAQNGHHQPKLGVNWVSRFISRHPELKTKKGRRQEANRFESFTPKAVNWYFDVREDYAWIKPENTANVDEGGLMIGFGAYLAFYCDI